jgi:hypothetical protein
VQEAFYQARKSWETNSRTPRPTIGPMINDEFAVTFALFA